MKSQVVNMKRLSLIYETVKELTSIEKGISAMEIAEHLQLDRSNVSRDLNKLVEEGQLQKIKGKPVLFCLNHEKEPTSTSYIEEFSKVNISLAPTVEKAISAVLYPPSGMHMMLLGETGVGKSMFAELIYQYTIEKNIRYADAPFVMFNCADYASNAQLLLSQLFGTKKGAYTGADEDRQGLVEKANRGILFLDEVHHLPPEGQEMLLTFIDKKSFRRLGETDERHAEVLIITATTADPESSLLRTFTRRIPMKMTIPPLRDRTLEERSNLIDGFFQEECIRLGQSIKVSVNSMRAFLSYHCSNNIGQLKTDIQLTCAKVYADFVTKNKSDVRINTIDLPDYIVNGLYNHVEHRRVWNRLRSINDRYFEYKTDDKEELLVKKEDTIYEMIDSLLENTQKKGLSPQAIEKAMDKDIEDYFARFIKKSNSSTNPGLELMVAPDVSKVIEDITSYIEEHLHRTISKKVQFGMAVHIANSIERVRLKQKIVHPKLHSVRIEHPEAFQVAIECLNLIDQAFSLTMPIDEAAFLTMFFVYEEDNRIEQKNNVNVIVIAHGESTATSMVNTANRLLGVQHAIGINAPLNEKPQDVLARLRMAISDYQLNSDILFLVDMGSLTTFGEELKRDQHINSKTISLVSTLHVLEATRKATMGYPLEKVYEDTINVSTLVPQTNSASPQVRREVKSVETTQDKQAIVTVCLTGEGTAKTMQGILTNKLKFDPELFDMVPVNLIGDEDISARLNKIEDDYQIITVLSTFELDVTVPQFNLYDLIHDDAIERIQEIINIETTYKKMDGSLSEHLLLVNGQEVLTDLRKLNEVIMNTLGLRMNTPALIGIVYHMASMLDRLKAGKKVADFPSKNEFIKKNYHDYQIVSAQLEGIGKKYGVIIPEDEVCYILSFFKK